MSHLSSLSLPPFILPKGFTYLKNIDPTIQQSVRYFSNENFMGRKMRGYEAPTIILTLEAAHALKEVQTYLSYTPLEDKYYSLMVYDAYRPQITVDDFITWSTDDKDQVSKEKYYPTVDKKNFFIEGYISKKSGHTRGSTIDLTLIEVGKKIELVTLGWRSLWDKNILPFLDDGTLDMGTSFDLLHPISSHDSPLLPSLHLRNRDFLRAAMEKGNFKKYEKEWWHYTLKNEPFPDTYFNFSIQNENNNF